MFFVFILNVTWAATGTPSVCCRSCCLLLYCMRFRCREGKEEAGKFVVKLGVTSSLLDVRNYILFWWFGSFKSIQTKAEGADRSKVLPSQALGAFFVEVYSCGACRLVFIRCSRRLS